MNEWRLFVSEDLIFLLNKHELEVFCFLIALAKNGVYTVDLPSLDLYEEEGFEASNYFHIFTSLENMGLIKFRLDENMKIHFEITPSAYAEYVIVDSAPWREICAEQTLV